MRYLASAAALGRHRRGLVSWQGPNRSVRRARASGPPTEGERRQPRLISQVTGQKGGRRGATRPGRLPLFVVFGRRQAVGRRTALFKLHQELGARMVDFGGWDMPVQYSSQIGEHHAVRRAAGVFDVSHMCIVDLKGAKVRALLEQLLANDVTKLKTPGRALYSCMLNERGGVIDDLIVYYLAESSFRAVVNASTRDQDLLWIRRHAAPLGVEVAERTDLAMLAIQGPEARASRGSSSDSCSKAAACCAATSGCSSPTAARARSRAARSLRHSSARLRSRASPPAASMPYGSTSAASSSPRASSSRRSCALASH